MNPNISQTPPPPNPASDTLAPTVQIYGGPVIGFKSGKPIQLKDGTPASVVDAIDCVLVLLMDNDAPRPPTVPELRSCWGILKKCRAVPKNEHHLGVRLTKEEHDFLLTILEQRGIFKLGVDVPCYEEAFKNCAPVATPPT